MQKYKKPSYIGTTAQLIELNALAEYPSTARLACRNAYARGFLAQALNGREVALVRIGKTAHIMCIEDLVPGLNVERVGILTSDDAGAVSID